jgi:hypothetical protein
MSETLSLVEELATVPDPRSPKGRRHPLTAILSLTVVATLAGCKGLEAIAQFGRDHGKALAHALGFTRPKTPNKSCLSKLFRRLDVTALEEALGRWILGRVEHHRWDAIAEAVCGITSLGRNRSDAKDLLMRTRGHWGIENRLHFVKDETLGEDRCRVRKGSGAQVLAAIRNACVHLLEAVETPSKAAAVRRLAAHPEEAVSLLFT